MSVIVILIFQEKICLWRCKSLVIRIWCENCILSLFRSNTTSTYLHCWSFLWFRCCIKNILSLHCIVSVIIAWHRSNFVSSTPLTQIMQWIISLRAGNGLFNYLFPLMMRFIGQWSWKGNFGKPTCDFWLVKYCNSFHWCTSV